MIEAGSERRKFFVGSVVDDKFKINPNHLYRPRDGDVVIVGAPKSGTSWLQQICHQIRTKGDESFDDIYNVTCYIAQPTSQLYDINGDQVCKPRIFKHHEVYGVIETTEKQKHLLIFRDPYDTTLSMMRFLNRWFGGDRDMDENETVELLGDFHKSKKLSQLDIMSTWWPYRDEPNVLTLFYEDVVAQPRNFIKKIADFLSIELTEDELNRVDNFCSFSWMEKHKEKFLHSRWAECCAMTAGIENWTPKMGVVRPGGGQVGQGKQQLSEKLKSIVDKLWEETMLKSFGFKNYQEMYNTYGLFNKVVNSD